MKRIKKELSIGKTRYEVSLEKPLVRYPGNPVLTSVDVNKVWTHPGWQVITAHNAGVTIFEEKVVMLFRSHLRNGISVIGLATSEDGITGWEINPDPFLTPCNFESTFAVGTDPEELIENEAGGVEDARISKIGDTYFITYSAYHARVPDRVRVSLATTRDFKSVTRHGPVLEADMRNVVIFPEKLGDKYYALMRPNDKPAGVHIGGLFREITLAETADLFTNEWEVHDDPVMRQSGGPSPFSHKIGPGATPIQTSHGWLNIFHGVRSTMDGNPYVLGVAFHDLHEPAKTQVCNLPVLFPTRADCRVDEEEYVHVPNVVFCCGATRQTDGTIYIYYGGNDTVMNVAFTHEDILFELTKQFPQDPLTGIPEYDLPL